MNQSFFHICFHLLVPSFPSYFMRRLQPRIEFGMQTVLPSVVNAVAGYGSTAVEAAQVVEFFINLMFPLKISKSKIIKLLFN